MTAKATAISKVMTIDYRRRLARAAGRHRRERARAVGGRAPSRAGAVVVLLVALAGVALAARLGVWQLDRAAQKIALQAALDARGTLPALDGRRRSRAMPRRRRAQHYRRVRLRGHLGRRAHRVPRQPADGRQGRLLRRHAAAPRGPARGGAGAARLGARATSTERTVLPRCRTPPGRVEVEGRHRPAAVAAVRVRRRRQRADPAESRPRVVRRARPGSTLLPLSVHRKRDEHRCPRRPARDWPRARDRRAEALRLRLPVVRASPRRSPSSMSGSESSAPGAAARLKRRRC